VPEDTETVGAPTSDWRFLSNSSTFGPVVNQSLLSAETTDSTSASLIECRPYEIIYEFLEMKFLISS
jgi:hypothetical protein